MRKEWKRKKENIHADVGDVVNLVSQAIWIGISIGVFFAGLGIGYSVIQTTTTNSFMMGPQQMHKMMNDPEFMAEWHQNMLNNPQTMNNWMSNMMNDPQSRNQMFEYLIQNPEQMRQWMIQDTQHIEFMSQTMKENHEFMQEMMFAIINDPDLRLQMLGHMSENQEAMQQMMQMTRGNMTGHGMMMGGTSP